MSFNKNNAQHSNPLEKKAMTATSTIQAYKDDTKREKRSLGLRSLLCPSLAVKIHKLLIYLFFFINQLSRLGPPACLCLPAQPSSSKTSSSGSYSGPARVWTGWKTQDPDCSFFIWCPKVWKDARLCGSGMRKEEIKRRKTVLLMCTQINKSKSRVKLKQAKFSLITRNFGGKDWKYEE